MRGILFSGFAIAVAFAASEASAARNMQSCSTFRDRCMVNTHDGSCEKRYQEALKTGYFKSRSFDRRMNQAVDRDLPCKP